MIKRLITALLAASCAVMAQTDSGSIRVFVADATQAQIAGAAVHLINAGTSVTVSA